MCKKTLQFYLKCARQLFSCPLGFLSTYTQTLPAPPGSALGPASLESPPFLFHLPIGTLMLTFIVSLARSWVPLHESTDPLEKGMRSLPPQISLDPGYLNPTNSF